MFVLFILHHILNHNWLKSIFKGKYTRQRTFNTIINIGLLCCMFGLIYSGICISRYVFTIFNFRNIKIARTIHMLCSYWGFILISLHMGYHGKILITPIKKRFHLKKLKKFSYTIVTIISIIGIYFFMQTNFIDYIFMRSAFIFLDFSTPVIITIFKYVSIMVLFAYIGFIISKIFEHRKVK